MTIDEAIEVIEYVRAFNEENNPLMKAWDLIIDYVRAQQEAERNEPLTCCKDCTNWKPGESMGGIKPGQIERLGECKFIRGAFMATDFCSRAKRRPPEKEEKPNV